MQNCSIQTTATAPWEASPPTLEIMGTKRPWSPPTFATCCHFFLWAMREADLLAKFKWRRKEEWVKHGWSNSGRRGRDRREKGSGLVSTIHPTWRPLRLFSRGCAYRERVCRYNWHTAGSLRWPFPMLEYECVFRIKYTEAILSKQRSETVMVWSYQNADCSLRKTFYRVTYHNFRHTFVPYDHAIISNTAVGRGSRSDRPHYHAQSRWTPPLPLVLASPRCRIPCQLTTSQWKPTRTATSHHFAAVDIHSRSDRGKGKNF